MGWLKIQKLEYLENGTELFYETKKILNLYLRWHILRSYRFVAEVTFKVGLSPSKNFFVICSTESPLKMTKNAFYFILIALFVLKIFKFLSRLFDHVGKTA